MPDLSNRHVVVVGAGIIGAFIAWYVGRRGARVTIVEAALPGGVATPCSFGWVNATHGNPRAYFDLRVASMGVWRKIASQDPQIAYAQTGTIYLRLDGHDGQPVDLDAFAKSHADWGYDIGHIEGDALRSRVPNLRNVPAFGLWAPCEAAAEGTEIAKSLVENCVSNGATLRCGTAVEALLVEGGRVVGVSTDHGSIEADEVVVAAGAATSQLVAGTASPIPLKTPPGILIHTNPCAPMIPHITLTKDLHIRQRGDGSILAGWDFGGGGGPGDPDVAAAQLLQKIKDTFAGADDVTLANVTVGLRPTPDDGFPVVGRPRGLSGLTIAVMHSGVTLAPFVGQALASYLHNGEMHPLLQRYTPDRFA